MIWEILGIEPTKDKKAITQAYREKLIDTNPEDKPEEFKQLRSAYEEALNYAESQQSVLKTEKEPVDLWRDQLEELYQDYPQRIKLENWKKLFEADVCQSLDSRMKAEDTLINFLMDHYFLPHVIWKFFDQQFSWKDRVDELYENYPRNFIDYIIINGINNPDTLPMDMFIPGKDGEQIQQYLNIYLKIRSESNEQSGQLIEEMLKMPEQHPYGNALALSYDINFVERGAIEKLKELQKQYPEDLHIAVVLITELFHLGKHDDALQLCEQFISSNPESGQLKYLYANTLAIKERYDEAITQINDLMRNAGGNHQYLNELDQIRRQWNEKVIAAKEQQLNEGSDDPQLRLDLGWAYLENDMYEKARDIVATVDGEKADKFDYYNLSSAIAYTGKNYQQAIEALDNLILTIQGLPQDGDEKTQKRKKRLGEMYGRKGSYLLAVDRFEEAMQYYELGLKSARDKASILTSMIGASLNARDYLKAEKYARELILERSDAFHGYLFLAYSLFSQNRDPEAFDAVNHALNLSLDLESFILKGRILIRNNALDEAQEVISFLEENNLRDDPAVLYLNGLLNQQKDDAKTALEYYEKADAAIENSGIHPFTDDLYYQYLNLKGETLDARKEEDRKLMLEIAEKGLKADPHHYDLLDYKAWLLTRDRQFENALEIYQELLRNPEHGPAIEAQIGYIYYQDIGKNAEKSLEYYLKAIEAGGNSSCYFYAGMCCMYLNRLDEAGKYFMLLREREPEKVDSYYRMSFVYAMQNNLEKAIENLDRAIEIKQNDKSDPTYYLYMKTIYLRRMCRPQQAVELLKDMIKNYDYTSGYRMIFDVYCQFGLFKEAENHLKSWRKIKGQFSQYVEARILYNILTGNIRTAKMLLINGSISDQQHRLSLEKMISDYERDYKKSLSIDEKMLTLEKQKENGGDLSRVFGNLSLSCFQLKMFTKQTVYAEKTIEIADQMLEEARLDELLYITRKIRALALSGKKDEARELLRVNRYHRLCECCPYHSCKDMEVFEMEIEIISGNYQKAYEMASFGKKRWPDEEAFLIMENALKKKVK